MGRKIMKKFISISLLFYLSISSYAFTETTAVPPLINYQGALTDSQGKGLTGTKKLEFNICDATTVGNKVWGPQVFDNVPIINGHFNVILGTTDDEGRSITDAFSEGTRFLGIKVTDAGGSLAGVSEITPRQQILSTPYAIKAAHHSNVIPPGTIVPFGGPKENIPVGWLLCDGSAESSTKYPALFAANGTAWGNGSDDGDDSTDFNIPELRGLFLRGVDHGAGRDPDTELRLPIKSGGNTRDSVGSFQPDEFKSHTHIYKRSVDKAGEGDVPGDWYDESESQNANTEARGGMETRPQNVAVNYIIKH